MNSKDILALYDEDLRIGLQIPGVLKETLPQVVRFRREPPGMNFVSYAWVDMQSADAVIADQVSYFSQFDQPYEWNVWEHDSPSDLKDRLLKGGFEADDDPSAVMALDLSDVPGVLLEPVKVDIRKVQQMDGLEDMIQVETAVWGQHFDWMRKRMGAHLQIPGYLSLYVAYFENLPVCAGWTYFPPNTCRFATIHGGSTLPEFRRQGYYTAILAARVQEARKRGCQYLVIDAGQMSRPIVASYGFTHLTTQWSYRGPSR